MLEWKPYPKQEKALLSSSFETLYGGARGGGKTDAGMAKPLYWTDHPLFRALVIRKNYTDLKDWRDRALRMYAKSGARSTEGDLAFPGGAKIVLGHLKDASAYTKYQGHEYQYMLIEELTQIPSEELYLKLISSCRSTVPELKPHVFATANPGGLGHTWVKKRFVDPAIPGDEFTDPVSGRTRIYIPATIDDNPALAKADPGYVRFLETLPPDLKAQWRYGSWVEQKIKGAVYFDDIRQAQAENRVTKLAILEHLPVLTSWDLGINNLQVVWFYQKRGDEIRFIDCEQGQNEGYAYWAKMLADKKYNYGEVRLPHDGEKRSPDSLRSFKMFLKEAGYEVSIIPRTKDKTRDIQMSRAIFPRCSFDEVKCAEGLDALAQYRYEYDEETQTFRKMPKHDWTSNYADAFQAAAVTIKDEKKGDDMDEAIERFMDKKTFQSAKQPGVTPAEYEREQEEAKRLIRL